MDPIEKHYMLTNDYFSWEREEAVAQVFKQDRIINAVYILKADGSRTTIEAKAYLKQMLLDLEADYIRNKTKFYAENPNASFALKKWIEVGGVAAASSMYWCAACPRHNNWQPMIEVAKASVRAREQTKIETGDQSTFQCRSRDMSLLSSSSSATKAQTNGNHDIVAGNSSNGFQKLSSSVLLAPIEYIESLPSKRVRTELIDAFNLWLQAPPQSVRTTKSIVDQLHNSSLMYEPNLGAFRGPTDRKLDSTTLKTNRIFAVATRLRTRFSASLPP